MNGTAIYYDHLDVIAPHLNEALRAFWQRYRERRCPNIEAIQWERPDDITFAQPDFSFPETRDWLVEQLTTQLINYGVGMKFDPQEPKQLSCRN